MDKKFLLPAGLIAVAIVAGLVIMFALDTGEPSAAIAPVEVTKEEVVYADLPTGSLAPVPVQAVAAGPVGLSSVQEALAAKTAGNEAARDAVLAMIDEATVTYDVQGLQVLGPLLQHPDPQIREATIEGIVQLSETAGAKTLRDAARQAKNPQEATRMIEAAEFLELPEYVPSSARRSEAN